MDTLLDFDQVMSRHLSPFNGFEPAEANFIMCPNDFLSRLVMRHTERGVVRLVGYVLYETLKWKDENGHPIENIIPVPQSKIVKHARVSKGAAKKTLDTCENNNYLVCVTRPQKKSANNPGRVGEYSLKWSEKLSDANGDFFGWYSGGGYWTPVPKSFFTQLLPNNPLSVIKVVAAITRHTVGFEEKFGQRRKQVSLSYDQLQKITGMDDGNLCRAINAAEDSGYIVIVKRGRFTARREDQQSNTYTLNWLTESERSSDSSKTVAPQEERFKIAGRRSVQNCRQDQFKIAGSNGSKLQVDDQFKIAGTIKKEQKENTKQQSVVADGYSILVDLGFTRDAARTLSTNHSTDSIRQQIDWLEDRNPTANKLGMLRRAIEEGWGSPRPNAPAKPTEQERVQKRDALEEKISEKWKTLTADEFDRFIKYTKRESLMPILNDPTEVEKLRSHKNLGDLNSRQRDWFETWCVPQL